MLDKLTIDDFQKQLNTRFKLDLGAGQVLALELIRVTKTTERELGEGVRVPFSVEFRGPESPVLEQRIYHLEDSEIGSLEIFLVPIGPDSQGMLYEAVFA